MSNVPAADGWFTTLVSWLGIALLVVSVASIAILYGTGQTRTVTIGEDITVTDATVTEGDDVVRDVWVSEYDVHVEMTTSASESGIAEVWYYTNDSAEQKVSLEPHQQEFYFTSVAFVGSTPEIVAYDGSNQVVYRLEVEFGSDPNEVTIG
ncbi:hypothetical protein NDI85_19960 [Halomicroarcula sp. S1AR25-4]|uniref:hypothetical protein n=1 Tax=Haloarcula sp. S1AR25-4 TaxID=2950538 RepID=UPI0028744F72|nr:hypothetical protein [Halomicroarcula sp. S1AR25-4]MDS0280064.1 hypothetical protein [Halomicroarcula sp. S1AR25-4]